MPCTHQWAEHWWATELLCTSKVSTAVALLLSLQCLSHLGCMHAHICELSTSVAHFLSPVNQPAGTACMQTTVSWATELLSYCVPLSTGELLSWVAVLSMLYPCSQINQPWLHACTYLRAEYQSCPSSVPSGLTSWDCMPCTHQWAELLSC